jgi:hypothetical protein
VRPAPRISTGRSAPARATSWPCCTRFLRAIRRTRQERARRRRRQARLDTFKYWDGRFDRIALDDRNLPAIVHERLLKPKDAIAKQQLDKAFNDMSMAAQGFVEREDGMLFIGPEAERKFGRRHFMGLMAVFRRHRSSPCCTAGKRSGVPTQCCSLTRWTGRGCCCSADDPGG